PVTDSQLRQQNARLGRIVLKLAAKARHEHAEVVRFLCVMRPPHLVEQESMRQYLAGVVDQCGKKFVFEGCQMDFLSLHDHAASSAINLEVVELENRGLLIASMLCRMAESHAESREQFGSAKGFGEIVVGPVIQRHDLLLFLVAC